MRPLLHPASNPIQLALRQMALPVPGFVQARSAPDQSSTEPRAIQPLRVLLADDQTLVRQGLVRLLALVQGVEVVAEACDGRQALELAVECSPNLLLLDVCMPHLGGLDVLRRLREQGDQVPVILLSCFAEPTTALSALRLGAHSYLLKDVDLSELVETMYAAVSGERRIHSTVPRALVGQVRQRPSLTSRELETLKLLASGYSNKQIGLALELQEGTVKNYVSSILNKLGVRDRVQAVMSALDMGMI